jgi:predicted nucleotidyltransferase
MSRRSDRYLSSDHEFREQLQAAVDDLVKEFTPEKIYLFGSLVEGKARPESSVDILIIASSVATSRFIARIKRAIKAANTLPHIAPLVYTPEEVEILQQQGDGFIQDILDDGKLLYKKK